MFKRPALLVIAGFTLLWAAAAIPFLASPLGKYPVVDARWHYLWASEYSSGNLSAYSPYFRAPLYPAVLGMVFAVTGSSVTAGAILSFFFGALTVHLVYLTVLKGSGGKAAVFCAVLTGVNGVFLFYSSTLLITPLYTLLLVLAFYLFQGKKSFAPWLVLGLASVARPSALLLAPVAFFIYPWSRRRSWLFLLPLAGVWAMNAAGGDPGTVISSQGGINFYIGSGPEADGFTAFAPAVSGDGAPPESLVYVDNVWAASLRPFPRGTAGSAVSSGWTEKTLEHVMENPVETLELVFKKLLYCVSPVAVPSNYDIYYCARYSPVLSVLVGTPDFPVSGLLLWLMLPGAILSGGMFSTGRRALLWIMVAVAGILPFFVTARYLLPLYPFMVILLGPGFLGNVRRSLLVAPAGLILGLLAAGVTSCTVESGGVNMAFHDGLAHYMKGDSPTSEMLLLRAFETASARTDGVDLNGTDALYNLGVLAAERGDAENAEMYWRRALERNPSYTPAALSLQGLFR